MNISNPAPVFAHYLERLRHLLAVVEHSGGDSVPTARLAPDMLPFTQQVRTAARFALRGCNPLFGLPLPPPPVGQATLADLRREVEAIHQAILALPQTERVTPRHAHISEVAGQTEVSLPAGQFLSHYLLPNFFFHLGMVYAIARQQGVPLGKGDFDGFHHYCDGFTFE